MSGSMPQQFNQGTEIQTTFDIDVQQLQSMEVTSDEFKELIVRLYQNLNKMVLAINLKDAAYYTTQEILTGQQFNTKPQMFNSSSYPTRTTFRKIIDFGTLPNTTTKSVRHNIGILQSYTFTRIYGAASNNLGNSFIPIPFASPTLNENISLEVTNTDVTLTTGINRTEYTTCYVILEYLKN